MAHRIVVYSSDEAQASERFIAYIALPVVKKGVVAGEYRLHVSFTGPDADTARSAAEASWQAEKDRERARHEAAERRGRALEAAREARKQQIGAQS